jgi:transcriptional regulator with XRE-family HTH domain
VTDRSPVPAQPFVDWLDGVVAVRGISWRRLAEEAGVSASALSALRNGKADRPSMETCYRLAGYLRYDLGRVLRLAGYDIPDQDVDIGDPELDLMFHNLLDLTPDERECVKEFVRFVAARSAARRRRALGRRG